MAKGFNINELLNGASKQADETAEDTPRHPQSGIAQYRGLDTIER